MMVVDQFIPQIRLLFFSEKVFSHYIRSIKTMFGANMAITWCNRITMMYYDII